MATNYKQLKEYLLSYNLFWWKLIIGLLMRLTLYAGTYLVTKTDVLLTKNYDCNS
jgi:hypothetical protein